MNSLSEVSLGTIEKLEHHPNADRLDIATVYGCPAIVSRDEYKAGDTVVVVPFDFIIPGDATYVDEKLRGRKVKPVRLRGSFSMMLVFKNEWNFTEKDNIGEKLNIVKWEPQCETVSDNAETNAPPGLHISKYDLKSLRQYHRLLHPGETVVIREKIHGASSRYVFTDGKLHIGSRSRWLKREDSGQWGKVADDLGLEEKLSRLPNMVLLGEVFGQVQDLKYDRTGVDFRAFDMYDMHNNTFIDEFQLRTFCKHIDIKLPPLLYDGVWVEYEWHKHLAEGMSMLGNNVREGFVVRPIQERYNDRIGRVVFKQHGEMYLTRKDK